MALKFRKRVKILPGVTLNFSKSGISTTIGAKGFSVNTGKKGSYLNVGVPGTGFYDRKKLNISGNSTKQTDAIVNSDPLKNWFIAEDNDLTLIYKRKPASLITIHLLIFIFTCFSLGIVNILYEIFRKKRIIIEKK